MKIVKLLLNLSGFILMLGILGCARQVTDPNQALLILADNLEAHNGISYDASMKFKPFNGRDTVEIEAEVLLIREGSDSAFGGRIYFKTTDGRLRLYDLKTIYALDIGMQPITYDAEAGQLHGITGNIASRVILDFFLKPDQLRRLVGDSGGSKTISKSETGDGHTGYTLTITYPDEEGFTNQMRRIWINNTLDQIIKAEYSVAFQGNVQYELLKYRNRQFDAAGIDSFAALQDALVASADWKTYEEPDFTLLAQGTLAPEFSGVDALTGKRLRLSDYRGKVVLLDFFYMACAPCIKTIPKLSALYGKFRDRSLVVLGVNAVDNHSEGKAELPRFIEKNGMRYPALLVDRTVEKDYLIKGYPGLYLIDRDGKVILGSLGYVENMEEALSSYIEAHL